MSWLDLIGYLTSILVFSTFYMKTMIPLRYVAIGSNVGWIVYGYFGGLYPVLILQLLLLPLNIVRLVQMKRLIKKVQVAAQGDLSMDWLVPFMTSNNFKKGEVLFQKGDEARNVYFLQKGSVRFVEEDKIVGQGEIIGEIGIFSPYKERTLTAICETDLEVFIIEDDKMWQLYYQNPEFGLYLVQLIIQRFVKKHSEES